MTHCLSRHRSIASLALALLSTALLVGSASAQTLRSDRDDYGPGTTATLTGSGFLAYEIVTLQVLHSDGHPSDGEDHDPWTITADGLGEFVTTWHVCEDDCVGSTLRASANGADSGSYAQVQFTDSVSCGTGVVTVTGIGSCVALTPAPGNGPDNWEVVQGGSYSMTITGVTECTGSTITVFLQNSQTGNFCFNATGVGGTYVGTFTMPNPACFTSPISYKCGASQPCNNANTFDAQGPTSGCGGVHLRASNFDANCNRTGSDEDCSAGCTPTGAPIFDNCTPATTDLGCNPDSIPGCDSTITAHDNCTALLVVGCTSTDTESGCSHMRTVTYTATNAFGTSQCVRIYTWVTDTLAPVFDNCTPGNTELGCNPASVPGCDPSITASDACGPAPVTCSSQDTSNACHHTRTLTYTATDGCGNSAQCVQTLTWTTDTTGPTFDNCTPGNTDLGCNPVSVPECDPTITASDACGSATVTCSSQDTGDACHHTRTLTYTATDACDNTAQCVRTLTWTTDTTAPTFTGCTDVNVNAAGACCATATFQVTASDECAGTVPVNCDQDSGTCFPIGTTTVHCSATDACGNTGNCSFNVNVNGRLCATKYYDANANGVRDDGEVGVAGWLILVNGANNTSTSGTTGADGQVCFDLPAGIYTVAEGTPQQTNWVHTTPVSCTVTIGPDSCAPSCSFGNYCFRAPSNGLTLGYWSNRNGQAILAANDPAWRTLLNSLNLRKADGTSFTVPTIGSFASAYASFRAWILGATATNMSYMLSAQLAATSLDVAYNGLGDGTLVVVPGGVKTGGGVCIVPYLSVTQAISCGAPPLLALTSVPGSTACGCSSNNGLVTIGDLRNRAVCLLGAYPTAPSASPQRTYEECVKNLLDMINNNGNNGYACGGLTQFINPSSSNCPATFQ